MRKKHFSITALLLFLPVIAMANASANETAALGAAPNALEECTKIRSSLERLACFDQVAGTPPMDDVLRLPGSGPQRPQDSHIMQLVQQNEAQRPAEDSRFIISQTAEPRGGTQVIISAPALGREAPRPYLAISCITNITRLQIVSAAPVDKNAVGVQFLIDGKPATARTTWQVLYSGEVVDAGRGLHAIDMIRRLGYGQRLQIASDHDLLNGLVFDISDLNQHISKERQACHW